MASMVSRTLEGGNAVGKSGSAARTLTYATPRATPPCLSAFSLPVAALFLLGEEGLDRGLVFRTVMAEGMASGGKLQP
ncbi:MAG: hypothetical protein COT06_03075 [Syntrophobacteraceae bacterium CG07_land_8_20_14_0_80_61_8]|nr:MAG: hypothetical protein COT06_03075 [Syntrophobacteraceae bacterium CG07_land_8_20_14_0_80_61_8]